MDYNQLVSVKLRGMQDVQSEIEANMNLVFTSTSIEVNSALRFLELMYRSGELVSGLGTNAVVYQGSDRPSFWGLNYPFKTRFVRDGFCAESNSVGLAFFITEANTHYGTYDKDWLSVFADISFDYNDVIQNNDTTMEGYFGGCFPLDALLESTLQCLYDSQCLNRLPDYFPGFNQVGVECL